MGVTVRTPPTVLAVCSCIFMVQMFWYRSYSFSTQSIIYVGSFSVTSIVFYAYLFHNHTVLFLAVFAAYIIMGCQYLLLYVLEVHPEKHFNMNILPFYGQYAYSGYQPLVQGAVFYFYAISTPVVYYVAVRALIKASNEDFFGVYGPLDVVASLSIFITPLVYF